MLTPAPKLYSAEDAALCRDYRELFTRWRPEFFDLPAVRALPPQAVYEEEILSLKGWNAADYPVSVPEGVTFGWFDGDWEELQRCVAQVGPGWVPSYKEGERAWCSFQNGRVASFCHVCDHLHMPFRGEMVTIGVPGEVGTLPAFRRQGIGLEMIRRVTEILKQEGCDYSYIHYTGVPDWYAKLGYRSFCRWNAEGIIED